jgi:hypothetical protein
MTSPQPMSTSSAGLLALAERCEAATGPSYALEVEIWDAIYPGEREDRWQEWLRVSPSSLTHNLGPADRDGYIKPRRAFTASLDAAMTLAVEGISAPDVLRHAITQCSRYGAPTFIEALPRFVAAQWLLARASQEQQQ